MPSFSAPSVKYRQPRRPVFYDSGHENQPREQRDHQRPPRANYAPPSGPSSPMDYEQSAKAAVRVTNLQHLKRALFNDSLAEMALQAGVQPVRLARMLDLEMIVDPGIAEHMERCMGLRPGFLDVRRDKWDESLTSEVRAQIKADESAAEPHDAPSLESTRSDVQPARPPLLSPKTIPTNAQTDVRSMTATTASTSEAQQVTTATQSASPAPASGSQWARYEHAGLRWLGEQLARMPRGSQTRLAALMGRSASDISAWVNCLRPVPASAMPQLVDAVTRLDASLGEQARAKLTVSAAKSEPLSDNLSDKRVTQAAPEPEKAPESAQNAAVVVAQPVQVAAEAVAKAAAGLTQASGAVVQAVDAENSTPVIQAPGYVGPDRRSAPAKIVSAEAPPAAVQADAKAPDSTAREAHTSLDQSQPVVYIQAPGYSGPERRVSQSSNYTGPERRKASQHLVLNEAEMLALRTVQSIAETLNRLTKTSG